MATRSTVVLHAYPDDETVLTGATLRRLADAGERVVLVTATTGETAAPLVRLRQGETLHERRLRELERACELLGVARLVALGYRDSGALSSTRASATGTGVPFRAASVPALARIVAGIVEDEGADGLVHVDRGGVDGRADRIQAHRVGAEVVRMLGVTGYEVTAPEGAVPAPPGADDVLTVEASVPELLAKMAAMATHASGIGLETMDSLSFAAVHGRERFVRRGAVATLDRLAAGPYAGPVGVARVRDPGSVRVSHGYLRPVVSSVPVR